MGAYDEIMARHRAGEGVLLQAGSRELYAFIDGWMRARGLGGFHDEGEQSEAYREPFWEGDDEFTVAEVLAELERIAKERGE